MRDAAVRRLDQRERSSDQKQESLVQLATVKSSGIGLLKTVFVDIDCFSRLFRDFAPMTVQAIPDICFPLHAASQVPAGRSEYSGPVP